MADESDESDAPKPYVTRGSQNWKHGPSKGASLTGAGWGGPAKGAGRNFGLGPDGRPYTGDEKAQKAADRAALREEAMQTWREIHTDPGQPAMARIVAADKLVDRIDGKAPQATVKYDGGQKTLEDLIAESGKIEAEERVQAVAPADRPESPVGSSAGSPALH